MLYASENRYYTVVKILVKHAYHLATESLDLVFGVDMVCQFYQTKLLMLVHQRLMIMMKSFSFIFISSILWIYFETL